MSLALGNEMLFGKLTLVIAAWAASRLGLVGLLRFNTSMSLLCFCSSESLAWKTWFDSETSLHPAADVRCAVR